MAVTEDFMNLFWKACGVAQYREDAKNNLTFIIDNKA